MLLLVSCTGDSQGQLSLNTAPVRVRHPQNEVLPKPPSIIHLPSPKTISHAALYIHNRTNLLALPALPTFSVCLVKRVAFINCLLCVLHLFFGFFILPNWKMAPLSQVQSVLSHAMYWEGIGVLFVLQWFKKFLSSSFEFRAIRLYHLSPLYCRSLFLDVSSNGLTVFPRLALYHHYWWYQYLFADLSVLSFSFSPYTHHPSPTSPTPTRHSLPFSCLKPRPSTQ